MIFSIDELQLTSSFSRQKHWTAKRASFFQSVHTLNVKKCVGGVVKCVGAWGDDVEKWGEWENMGEVWESERRYGKVCWNVGKVRGYVRRGVGGVGKCDRVWGSVGGGVGCAGKCVGMWGEVWGM